MDVAEVSGEPGEAGDSEAAGVPVELSAVAALLLPAVFPVTADVVDAATFKCLCLAFNISLRIKITNPAMKPSVPFIQKEKV